MGKGQMREDGLESCRRRHPHRVILAQPRLKVHLLFLDGFAHTPGLQPGHNVLGIANPLELSVTPPSSSSCWAGNLVEELCDIVDWHVANSSSANPICPAVFQCLIEALQGSRRPGRYLALENCFESPAPPGQVKEFQRTNAWCFGPSNSMLLFLQGGRRKNLA